jgi:hypothetical protein
VLDKYSKQIFTTLYSMESLAPPQDDYMSIMGQTTRIKLEDNPIYKYQEYEKKMMKFRKAMKDELEDLRMDQHRDRRRLRKK